MTPERLKEVLHYNPETGVFTWLIRSSSRVRAGMTAGCDDGKGYVRITFEGRDYAAHRLAWLYMTGSWPTKTVDHINGDPADNRFANLRLAVMAENGKNRKISRNNKTGYKGVRLDKKRGTYRAVIVSNGKSIHLGVFKCPKEAYAAYCRAAEMYHGPFARLA